MSQVTTQVFDTAKGHAAKLLVVVLFKRVADEWFQITKGITNSEGKIPNLLPDDDILPNGVYKLRFETKHYFDALELKTLYPAIEIIFEITGKEHYHIPLLLGPFGYSTYKGC